MATKKKETKKRPELAYKTPQELKTAVDKYFADCDHDHVFPDEAGMRVKLGLIGDLASEYEEADEGYRRVFDYARDRRESWLTRRMASDARAAQGCMNALKQEKNGGYIDRPEKTNQKQVVEIKFSGNIGKDDFK